MEQITSSQLGYDIFNSCLRWARFVIEQKNPLLLRNAEREKANVNFEEILIGFMWAIFDLLNTNPKYEKATHFLFGGYVSFLDLDKKETDQKMWFLEKKFHEYKNLFRKDGKTDYNYWVVTMVMSENITGEMNHLFFATDLAISIQEFIIMWGKLLDNIEVIDE